MSLFYTFISSPQIYFPSRITNRIFSYIYIYMCIRKNESGRRPENIDIRWKFTVWTVIHDNAHDECFMAGADYCSEYGSYVHIAIIWEKSTRVIVLILTVALSFQYYNLWFHLSFIVHYIQSTHHTLISVLKILRVESTGFVDFSIKMVNEMS